MSVRLAVTGSNLTGDVPFSAAVATEAGTFMTSSPAGERGDLTRLCMKLCDQQGLTPADIREVIIDVGPGSYTGLRVAVTFVRFLQAFGSISVRGVDSLALLAHHACPQAADGLFVRPLLDARRGRFHTASYEHSGGQWVAREAANASPTEIVFAALKPEEHVIVPVKLAEQIGDELRARNVTMVVANQCTATALLATGLPSFAASAEDLEPRYLMATYAED